MRLLDDPHHRHYFRSRFDKYPRYPVCGCTCPFRREPHFQGSRWGYRTSPRQENSGAQSVVDRRVESVSSMSFRVLAPRYIGVVRFNKGLGNLAIPSSTHASRDERFPIARMVMRGILALFFAGAGFAHLLALHEFL